MLEIENFKKSFGTKPLLDIPQLILDQKIYWIKGENGTGKTTLLKCLAGISSFCGNITLDQIALKQQPRKYLQKVNFSQTEPTFPDFLTGMQLIAFFIKAKQGSFEQINKLLDDFQMKAYIDAQPLATYSSGMLKKLSLILAFLGKPTVVLLDEPYISLDLQAIETLNKYLENMLANKTTVLLTTHLDSLDIPCEIINLELLVNHD